MANQKKKQNKKQPKKHFKTYKLRIDATKQLGLDIVKENKKTIPIFIPHFGCKNECVFCNQRRISGQQKPVYPEDVKVQIDDALNKYKQDEKEIQITKTGNIITAQNQITENTYKGYLYAGKGNETTYTENLN